MALEIGHVIDGKYTIRRLIGSGGMGKVYEGENTLIHRRVAIKVLNAKVADEPGFVRRFEREAQAAGRIGSDHIVEVLDLGTLEGGDRYMVMEFLEGESLRQRIDREGAMAPERVFPILIGLLDGLDAAHRADILHRDLKPANVFLSDDRRQHDFVKILDFGVSKFIGLDGDDATATGMLLGTPKYMAPEQAKGDKEIDARADLYSVGVVLYRSLTGRAPFVAETYNELLFKVVLEDPPSLSSVLDDADPDVVSLVAKAMARERDERFQSADEMAAALRSWLADHGHPVPPLPMRHPSRSGAENTQPAVSYEATGSTKMAASSVMQSLTATRKRSWLSLIAALAAVGLGGALAVWQVRASRPPATDAAAVAPAAPSETPKRPETPSEPELPATTSAETAPEATASPEGTASAVPTASAAPSTSPPSIGRAAAPTATTPPATTPPPKSGPVRKYRRDL